VEGIELQPGAAAPCRRNLAENGLSGDGILTGDLREYRSLLKAGAYDLVISNPPYFPVDSGYSAPDLSRAAARDERTCTLDELCAAAGWLCRWGGAFALVHRPERLAEIFCALRAQGLEPKRLRLVQHRAERAPSLALIEARRGGKPGMTVCAPLLLCGPDGGDSPEIREIYHMR
jgi:tRNA1(Val) A37 N6-methylase TrmN6